jgi:DNA-directed RNA polymerase specialized sigma24 family protein
MSMTMRAVRHAQDGDRDALAFLYARYADDVYGYVRGGVQDRREAEELTRQVFATVAGTIGDYEEREMQFSAWVMCAARRLVRERDCGPQSGSSLASRCGPATIRREIRPLSTSAR